MPTVTREDGVEIHWEERGEGPLIVVALHWSAHPAAFQPLLSNLSADHRVVIYDARGTGDSSRQGPYDLVTDSADLAAAVEAAGGGAVALAWGDGGMRAARVASRDPSLVVAVIGIGGGGTLGRRLFADTGGLGGSDQVYDAFRQALRTDYRSALHQVVRHSNLEMDEDEVRARVDAQITYCSQEAAEARWEILNREEALDDAVALRDRISLLLFETNLGPLEQMYRRARELLPDAEVVMLDEGPISRPDLTAAHVRRVTASQRAGTETTP